MSKRLLATAALAAAAASPAHAAIQLTDGNLVYSQDFNTLASSGATVPWLNDNTLAGWSLFTASGTAIASYTTGTGSTNTGSFFSFGATGSAERALGGIASGGAYFGSPASGAVAGYIAVAFTNSSSIAFDSFTLRFDGEQWRNGGNTSAQTMALQYGFGSSFAGVSNWTAPGGNFDWSSPTVGSTAAAVDGNASGLLANRGGTVNGLSWNPGETLWIRWVENNDTGNDHGLAIDNVALSVTSPVPEPSSYALMLAGLCAVGLIARRRRRD